LGRSPAGSRGRGRAQRSAMREREIRVEILPRRSGRREIPDCRRIDPGREKGDLRFLLALRRLSPDRRQRHGRIARHLPPVNRDGREGGGRSGEDRHREQAGSVAPRALGIPDPARPHPQKEHEENQEGDGTGDGEPAGRRAQERQVHTGPEFVAPRGFAEERQHLRPDDFGGQEQHRKPAEEKARPLLPARSPSEPEQERRYGPHDGDVFDEAGGEPGKRFRRRKRYAGVEA
jgi:hypothetical protein